MSKMEKLKAIFKRKIARIVAIVLFVCLVGLGVYKSPIVQKKLTTTSNIVQKTATVKKGDLNITVTGSGALYCDRTSAVASKVASTVKKIYFKEGDTVKTGDLIYEFDAADAQLTVEQKQNSLQQTQLSNVTNDENINKLTVKAPFTGQVTSITYKKGDTISKGANLFTITDTSLLKLTTGFNENDVNKIALNQKAVVYIAPLMQTVEGTVSYISNQATSTSTGGKLYYVEIQIQNPGALTADMSATADIETGSGTVSSASANNLAYVNKKTVTSEIDGTIDSLLANENQRVSAGSTVIKIKNDELIRTKTLGQLKADESQSQINSAQEELSYYKIVSPIDGVISKQTLKEGDSVKSGDVVTTVTDTSTMQFDVNIDELDIAKIAVGQKAKVTVDALTETSTTPLEGEVVKISFTGTSSNGVSTFPVTIRVNEKQDKLKAGMNASAEIQVGSVKDALYVPIEAVSKTKTASTVWVKSDKAAAVTSSKSNSSSGNGSATGNSAGGGMTGGMLGRSSSSSSSSSKGVSSQQYYANAEKKEVQVGINNDTYIEIKSGLNEGDIVILPQSVSSSSANNQQQGGPGSPMGGGQSSGGSNSNRSSSSK